MTDIIELSSDVALRVVEGWGELADGSVPVGDVGDIGVDSDDRVFVLNRGQSPVTIFDRDGAVVGSWGKHQFTRPHGLFVGADRTVYTADDVDHTVRKWTFDGQLLMTLGERGVPSDTGCRDRNYRTVEHGGPPFNMPTGVVVAEDGSVYVTDGYCNARVHRFSQDGRHVASWGEPGGGPGEFNLPHNLALGPSGNVFVADRQNSRIQIFTPEGELLDEWTDLQRPNGIAISQDGLVYVASMGMVYGHMEGMPEPTDRSPRSSVSVHNLDGSLLSRWGNSATPSPGTFTVAHAIAVDSTGALYVGEVLSGPTRNKPPEGARVLHKFERIDRRLTGQDPYEMRCAHEAAASPTQARDRNR